MKIKMDTFNYKQALLAFGNYHPDLPTREQSFEDFIVTPLSGGLINQTYKVESPLSTAFVLQQINQSVFPQPWHVQHNYIHIWEYAEFEFTGLRMPSPMYYETFKSLFKDDNETYWRAFEYIPDNKTTAVAKKATQAKATARAFGKFTAAFDDFNTGLLRDVIPDFHNLVHRYTQFEESLQTELYERTAKCLPFIDELKKRERYKFFYEEITASAEFPKRVMHHDAKIANVLFSSKTGKVICPVDYDTVMPGYFFSDLGDMIRSMAGSTDEANTDNDSIHIRKDFYEAIISGYLLEMDRRLTVPEKKYIHYAGILMVYMQALRFLTDYLNGDTYYKTTYAEQNFDRALNQLTLLKRLEEFLSVNYGFKS